MKAKNFILDDGAVQIHVKEAEIVPSDNVDRAQVKEHTGRELDTLIEMLAEQLEGRRLNLSGELRAASVEEIE